MMKKFGYAATGLSIVLLAGSCSRGMTQTVNTPPAERPEPPASAPKAATSKKETRITGDQAKELFRSVDQITQFASQDTGYASKGSVKRKLVTRDEVERYITEKFHEDKDTQKVERSEIVLKKFGLLDRDFQLEPFLVSLLKEQVAGYYDSKTKTVNLLDWITPDEQKPVLAHELTHALQDEHVDLEKWGDKSVEGLSRNAESDNQHVQSDENDTARDAVVEGQAMAVFVDWGLKDRKMTIRNLPNIEAADASEDATSAADSPVLARAPLVLQQQLLFPYKEGLNFEQVLLQDKGTGAAFAGTLDRPPSTTYEVMNPKAYEAGKTGTVLRMPDIHPLIDVQYEPYDVGAMGELDVRMVAELFGGRPMGAAIAEQWDGGLYYAAQSRDAKTPEQKAKTRSVALFYLSQWKTEAAAQKFAMLYASSLNRKYSSVKRDDAESSGTRESVYQTEEGPVLIAVAGKDVFVSESFDLALARKLQILLVSAQSNGEQEDARLGAPKVLRPELTALLSRYLCGYGVMRAALRH